MSWSCSMNPTSMIANSASGSGSSSTTTGMSAADFLRYRDATTATNSRSAVLLSKYRLKCAVTVHVLLVLLATFRLSIALFVLAGVRPPRFLQKLRLPIWQNWELVWLLGNVVTCVLGVVALMRNRALLVRLYAAGSLFGGLIPAVYAAAFYVADDLIEFCHTHETKLVFHGVPVIIIWSMFLAVAVQLHLYALYFSWSLLRAWKQRAAELKATRS